MEMDYEPIDHTADAGFRVRGVTLPALFENAARCLCEAVSVTEGVAASAEHAVELRADDVAALLRAWLSEVLYVSYVKHLVLTCATVDEVTEGHLRARLCGAEYDEARHERHPEIKAVTWHDLAVTRLAEGWEAVFIVDL